MQAGRITAVTVMREFWNCIRPGGAIGLNSVPAAGFGSGAGAGLTASFFKSAAVILSLQAGRITAVTVMREFWNCIRPGNLIWRSPRSLDLVSEKSSW